MHNDLLIFLIPLNLSAMILKLAIKLQFVQDKIRFAHKQINDKCQNYSVHWKIIKF